MFLHLVTNSTRWAIHSLKFKSSFFKSFSAHLKLSTDVTTNYYSVLGVKPESSDEEIKKTYYALSKKYHPDMNVGNEFAKSKILEINEAFEVLGNKNEREKYDSQMFPKISQKKMSFKNFIYDYDEFYCDKLQYTYRSNLREKVLHSYNMYTKGKKADQRKRNKHMHQNCRFSKMMGSKLGSRIISKH